VLEGVAYRGCDLLLAAEADSGLPIDALRIDGGMSANEVFTQALADACGRPIEISPVLEATTLGAAYLAGMAVGTWKDEQDIAGTWAPRRVVEPSVSAEEQGTRRERWLRARSRSEATIPELSGLDF
jgi:glycerol kinase